MRNQKFLKMELADALKSAGVPCTVTLFKRIRLASSIRVLRKGWRENRHVGFTPEQVASIIDIAIRFDMRQPNGLPFDVEYVEYVARAYTQAPDIHWWVYT